MKNFKFISIALALLMTLSVILSCPVNAYAAAELPVITIDNSKVIEYTTVKPSLVKKGKSYYIYDFVKSRSSGYGFNDQFISTEANYGLTSYVDGQTLYVKFYNHTNRNIKINSAVVESIDKNNSMTTDITLTPNNYRTIDTSKMSNGLYRVVEKLSNGKNNGFCFYVNGKETWLCSAAALSDSEAKEIAARKSDLAKILKNGSVKTGSTISNDAITYPSFEVPGKYRCDTQRWADLSGKLVKDSWSDEYKLYTMCEWMIDNIAYDSYKRDNFNHSRAVTYGDSTGTWSIYNTKTGVCFDYANILVIMCRAQGIPATTIGSKSMNHVWNVVYINDRWIEIDLSSNARYQTKAKDVTNRTTFYSAYNTLFDIIATNTVKLPSDATANKWLQENSTYVY